MVDHDPSARPSRWPWPPILLVLAAGGALLLGRFVPLPWPGVDDAPAHVIGLTLGALGIGLVVWAGFEMRKAHTTILPHAGADALVTTGPFRRFRNPIYLGDTLILLGLAEVTKNVWFVGASVVFVLLVTWLAIVPEERHLEARFGDEYRDYKQRSRRWI